MSVDTPQDAQSMLWPDSHDQPPKDPERQLLDAIASGPLDQHLVGDTVTFTRRVRPRYLGHELAVIEELEDHWVTVRLGELSAASAMDSSGAGRSHCKGRPADRNVAELITRSA